MGKCNLLAPVSNETGNFILFSQYAEDLTRQSQSEDYYRVVPSRYVVMDINSTCDDVSFSEYFQNYYENACSVLRSSDLVEWTPETAQRLFWKSLMSNGMVNFNTLDEGRLTSGQVLYVGDISITSSKQYDSINYSEIYVDVPGEQPKRYAFDKGPNNPKRISYTDQKIVGWPDSEYPGNDIENWLSNDALTDGNNAGYYEIENQYFMTLDDDPVETLDDSKYTFNAVLVLYDVKKRNIGTGTDEYLYRDIPMGLYITGKPVEDEGIGNPITIWANNPDIYNQGTSFGFRICTRYLSTQNELRIIDSTIEDTREMYDQYCAVMAKIGDSQVKMDEILKSVNEYQQNITSHIANVKNYRVNVPYIRTIGGKNYWFVNGRNLGISTTETSLVWENC